MHLHKVFVFLIFGILFFTNIEAQSNDTGMLKSVKIIPNKKVLILPVIVNSDFCNKIKKIVKPSLLNFFDDNGDSVSYYVNMRVNFNNRGKVRSIASNNKNIYLEKIVREIKHLLTISQWKFAKDSPRSLKFTCLVVREGVVNLALSTLVL
ncbi:hypothetical protein [Niabella drilacis]|uniref:Uncharacterized protein n=1 Tax=Niabella drilacis (strain DSM 25811 / CCM 8410 / CCUG 62505 / LMG 26954 / E90) TaxID=1285928 RepID=A0A1G6ZD59_NIADE|nr:hypothetical protein [Niabella drilacis]SDE00574.1 hypothetical protein SAMN04487894_1183 [Niabella drilacis]